MRGSIVTMLLALATPVAAAELGSESQARAWRAEAFGHAVPVEDHAPCCDPGVVEPIASVSFLRTAGSNAAHVVTAPLRWRTREWSRMGWTTAALAVGMAVLDEPVRDAVGHAHRDEQHGFLGPFEPLGQPRYTTPVLLGVYLGGLWRDNDRARAIAIDGVVATIVSNVLVTEPLKLGFGRARPRESDSATDFDPGGSTQRSFPSGHATQAFTVASVFASHFEEAWIDGVAYGIAGLVAAQRLENDDHWLTDVAAGALIGTLVGKSVVHRNRNRRALARAQVRSDGRSLVLVWEF